MHVARLYGAAIEFDEEPGRRSSCLTLILTTWKRPCGSGRRLTRQRICCN